MGRLFYGTLNHVVNKINLRFSQRNLKLYSAISAPQHENRNSLDVKIVTYSLDLAKCPTVEADFDVAEMYIAKLDGDDMPNMVRAKLLCEQCKAFKVVLTVQLALKLAVTFGVYIAMCGAGSGVGAKSATLEKLELESELPWIIEASACHKK